MLADRKPGNSRWACPLGLCMPLALALAYQPLMAADSVIGEHPVILEHLQQADIDAGLYALPELFAAGQLLFDARFNLLDGRGRPFTTGGGAPRANPGPDFLRTSAPDANSCQGCHGQPRSGGAGDFVANVFVLAQTLDPVTESVSGSLSNERNTLGMFGAGVIEMLAREMTAELVAIRTEALADAADSGMNVSRQLVAKGVEFGYLTAQPDGRIDPTGIEGVDWDLIIKPFHQKGAVVSLREFSNNAMNHHHGMQTVERFGAGTDPDGDNVLNELTAGDVTAVTLYQAALPAPRPARPAGPGVRTAKREGAALFSAIGCGRCHLPELVLENRMFSEPNPWNPPGNLTPAAVAAPFEFDLVQSSRSPFVRPLKGQRVLVQAFTDLKRHDLNDAELDHFANEQVAQGSLTGFASAESFTVPPRPRPTREFLTRKLWDAGNSDPYGHRGDLSTLTEAIYWHGGDARTERDTFMALPAGDQARIIEFLKSMVVE